MFRAAALIVIAAAPAFAGEAPADGFCIENASAHTHLFQTETREGVSQSATLAPGERLCASGSTAMDGVARVFESADAVEGCGRIVPLGETEALIAYAEFDRCEWRSHGS